jgi:hypothetical protein
VNSKPASISDKFPDRFSEIRDAQNRLVDPVCLQQPQLVSNEGFTGNREEGLRDFLRQRAQARRQAPR